MVRKLTRYFYIKFDKSKIEHTTNWNCKDSICNDPKLVLGSYVKSPNNKICRAWAERLGFGHRTIVNRGIHGGRAEAK